MARKQTKTDDMMRLDDLYTLADGRQFIDAEQSRIFTAIIEISPFDNEDYRWDELSIAEIFAGIHKDNTLYCPEAKSWYVYDGRRWTKDIESLETMERLATFTKLLMIYFAELMYKGRDRDKLADFQKFLFKLSDRRARERILKDAQTAARVPMARFDSDPYLVNCLNGTYNLKTGRLQSHRADDYITMMTACDCPTAAEVVDFPRWTKFIDEITCGDADVADYLQRALGYSLLGECKEECMFIAYGKTTRNGKGTLFNTVEKILGDYAKAMPAEFICKTRYGASDYGAANPMVAGLNGKRFVTISESDALSKLNEQSIKSFTGGDPITARNLYEKDFTFTPVFKLWLQCNTLPSVADRSVFTSDRIKVINFDAHFDEAHRDTTLKSQFLTDEAKKVIFAWLADGYRKYSDRGLKEPRPVKSANESYEAENDRIRMFIEDCCREDGTAKVKQSELYGAYKTWCKSNGFYSLPSPKFKEEITRYASLVTVRGVRMYKGLALVYSDGGDVDIPIEFLEDLQ